MAEGEKKQKFDYGKYFAEGNILHSLQVAPEDQEWQLSAPKGQVRQADVVLYLGCNILKTSHLVRTVVDVFKLLDVDFVAVGGASYCCGIQHYNHDDVDASKSVAETTARNFEKFGPKEVVMWCPSCIFFYDEIMGMQERFSFQHVTQYLLQHLDKLDFQPVESQRISLHYHTGRPQSDAEAESAMDLLSRVPGLDLVDLGTDARFGRHCTGQVREKVGPEVWDGIVADSFRRSVEAGIDTYTTLYHGCHRALCRYEKDYPVKVEHYLSILGRSLGIEHEDLYKKYLMMGNEEAIMEETSPCAIASGISPEVAAATIRNNFVNSKIF